MPTATTARPTMLQGNGSAESWARTPSPARGALLLPGAASPAVGTAAKADGTAAPPADVVLPVVAVKLKVPSMGCE
ncbi:hypothetical protein SB659_20390, partial [Arthrobacter sp. SIMBA_036]|uniref:hypothetical protein n=1 Tax=Arthrobacter sp. SIMBA_036 TaxID=3085778 RepID=UPI003977F8E2